MNLYIIDDAIKSECQKLTFFNFRSVSLLSLSLLAAISNTKKKKIKTTSLFHKNSTNEGK